MTEATMTESTMIVHDFVNPPPEEKPITCPICGMDWEDEDYADVCCLPGVKAYANGAPDGWTISHLPERFAGVAFVDRHEDLVRALTKTKRRRGWRWVADELRTSERNLRRLRKGDKVWLNPRIYGRLQELLGDEVPGVVYWPSTMSCPVGREDYA